MLYGTVDGDLAIPFEQITERMKCTRSSLLPCRLRYGMQVELDLIEVQIDVGHGLGGVAQLFIDRVGDDQPAHRLVRPDAVHAVVPLDRLRRLTARTVPVPRPARP